jgi:hypothetical protein
MGLLEKLNGSTPAKPGAAPVAVGALRAALLVTERVRVWKAVSFTL